MKELICTAQNFSTGKDARGEIQITMQNVRLDQQTDVGELINDVDIWALAEKLIEYGFSITPPPGTSFRFDRRKLIAATNPF